MYLYNTKLDNRFIEKLIHLIGNKILVICGPTSAGKSDLAIQIADKMISYGKNASIINSDAMQIYAELQIITGQPSIDDRRGIEHLLYGYFSIEQFYYSLQTKMRYSVMNWIDDALLCMNSLIDRKILPILVGGSGMYINSLIFGIAEIPKVNTTIIDRLYRIKKKKGMSFLYNLLRNHDNESSLKISQNDEVRIIRALSVFYSTGHSISYWQKHHHKRFYPKDSFFLLYMHPKRDELYNKINTRVLELFHKNCYDEFVQYKVRLSKLYKKNPSSLEFYDFPKVIGINEMIKYGKGICSLNTAIDDIQQTTRRYARKQYILFNTKKNEYDLVIS